MITLPDFFNMPGTDFSFYTLLQQELLNLPGEEAHVEMFPLRARTSEALKAAPDHRISAVMVIFYAHENSHRLILIERQDYDGKHSGQIGFPGGKIEPGDTDEQAAALRETFEEIGISPNAVSIVGKLTNVYIPVSNFLVHPFVGYLDNEPVFSIDAREVKSVQTISVDELLNDDCRVTTSIIITKGTTLKEVPAFCIREKIIWGATALMLNELKVVLRRVNCLG